MFLKFIFTCFGPCFLSDAVAISSFSVEASGMLFLDSFKAVQTLVG